MKKILLFFGLLISIHSIAQTDTLLTYSEVIQVDSISKSDLFINARSWFNNAFKSSKDVLQISDKESGELSGKAIISGTYIYKYLGSRETPYSCNMSISIKVKDNKYKYEISNFEETVTYGNLYSGDHWHGKMSMVSQKRLDDSYRTMKAEVNNTVLRLIADLKKSMIKKSKDDF
jgi:hypothetical protein